MRIRCRLGIAAITLAATTGVGFAQVEEIVVTAQRREQTLQTVPLAVSAFGAQQAERLQINVTKDIGENVPNLQTYTVTAGGQAMQVHARGASVQNPGFNLSESPVGIYLDDVYQGRLAAANLDLLDVERIEVLRGPQATLYGRNTIAGAIKVVTRTPGDDRWADASIGYGNYQTVKVGGSIGGPIEEGMLAGSMSVLYHDRSGGWQPNPERGTDVGRYTDLAARAKLHWYGTENFNAVLSAWAVDVENDGYNGVPYAPFSDPATAPFGAPGDAASAGSPLGGFYDNWSAAGSNFGESDQAGFSLDWSWNLGPATLRSITGYANVKDRFGFDLAGGGFLGIPGNEGLLINSDGSNDTWTQEIQLLGSALNDQLDWIVGGFYMNEDGSQDFGGTLAAFGIDFLEQIESKTDSYAAFAEGTWRFTNQWSVTGGVRWTPRQQDAGQHQHLQRPDLCRATDGFAEAHVLRGDRQARHQLPGQ
jgi:iron complex outermembrane recepter protein